MPKTEDMGDDMVISSDDEMADSGPSSSKICKLETLSDNG